MKAAAILPNTLGNNPFAGMTLLAICITDFFNFPVNE